MKKIKVTSLIRPNIDKIMALIKIFSENYKNQFESVNKYHSLE